MARPMTMSKYTGIRPGHEVKDVVYVADPKGNRKQRRAAAKIAKKKAQENREQH